MYSFHPMQKKRGCVGKPSGNSKYNVLPSDPSHHFLKKSWFLKGLYFFFLLKFFSKTFLATPTPFRNAQARDQTHVAEVITLYP